MKTGTTVARCAGVSCSGLQSSSSGSSVSGSWSSSSASRPGARPRRRFAKADSRSPSIAAAPKAAPASGDRPIAAANSAQAVMLEPTPRQVLWSPSRRVPSRQRSPASTGAAHRAPATRPSSAGAAFAATSSSRQVPAHASARSPMRSTAAPAKRPARRSSSAAVGVAPARRRTVLGVIRCARRRP
ncbi:MAG: hypothetical protein MZV64_67790 [Ignavibacteriales bacterium]|nr:hypothetical protein [Ignavibacteriales bacterium]